MKICLNHNYYLRHDERRTFIVSKQTNPNSAYKFWISIIHPIYAMALSLLSRPLEKEEAISSISAFFGFSKEQSTTMIESFLQEGGKIVNYGGHTSRFPEDILLVDQDPANIVDYNPAQFIYNSLDFNSVRFQKAPLSILWMVTDKCLTSCQYCYANKSKKSRELSLEQVKDFLDDLKTSDVKEIHLTGGDIFCHPHWQSILHMIEDNGFDVDLLSTKVPLSNNVMEFLQKKVNYKLQISLDSTDSEILSKTLKVPFTYGDQILKSITNINKSGIKFQVATVLTSATATLKNIIELYNFLSKCNNLHSWKIRFAHPSLYTSKSFDQIKAPDSFYETISEWLDSIDSPINIGISKPQSREYRITESGSQDFQRSRCSANTSNLVVLPDGKVTICEQLYWNPRFIVGDITKQSIIEIWQGEKALSLYNHQQSQISKSSPCSDCEIFDKCNSHKNQCIADILKAYGDENWDYPDPHCAKAPEFINPIM